MDSHLFHMSLFKYKTSPIQLYWLFNAFVWDAFSSSFSLHRLEVHIKSFSHMPQTTAKHTRAHTHIHTQSNPPLLSHTTSPFTGPQEKGIYSKQAQWTNIEIHRQAQPHICSSLHIHAHTHRHAQALPLQLCPRWKDANYYSSFTGDFIAITICKFQSCLK